MPSIHTLLQRAQLRWAIIAVVAQCHKPFPKKIVLWRISQGETFRRCKKEALRGLSQKVAGPLILLGNLGVSGT